MVKKRKASTDDDIKSPAVSRRAYRSCIEL
jgi:hypothetical protein